MVIVLLTILYVVSIHNKQAYLCYVVHNFIVAVVMRTIMGQRLIVRAVHLQTGMFI